MTLCEMCRLTGTTPGQGGYDPELLLVECSECGRPVLWGEGKTTDELARAGISREALGSHCLLMTDGCPRCHPEAKSFDTQLVCLGPTSTTRGLARVVYGRA